MKLTSIEQRMYDLLMKDRDGVSREVLKEVKPLLSEDDNRVDVHIKNIRRKIKEKGMTIESIRGFGYRLIPIIE